MSELAAQGSSAPSQGSATEPIALGISHSEQKGTVARPHCLPGVGCRRGGRGTRKPPSFGASPAAKGARRSRSASLNSEPAGT